MASRKPNGTWLSRIRTSDGSRVSYVFPTREIAEQWETTARSCVAEGRDIPDPHEARETIGEFFPKATRYIWADSNNLHRLMNQAQRLANEIGTARAVATVTKADAVSFRKRLLADGAAGSTLNNYAATFNRIMKHAGDLGIHATPPSMDYAKQRKGKVRFLSEGEEQRLINYFDHMGREDYADLTQVLIYTGGRVGEVLRTTWEDYATDRVTFWETKSGHPRTVPLSRRAQSSLQRRRGMSPNPDKPFPFAYRTYKQAFDKATDVCQIEDCTPHTLRHTCASRLVQAGVDIRRVKDWMGHSTIQTTMIYAHLAPADLFSAVDALDGIH